MKHSIIEAEWEHFLSMAKTPFSLSLTYKQMNDTHSVPSKHRPQLLVMIWLEPAFHYTSNDFSFFLSKSTPHPFHTFNNFSKERFKRIKRLSIIYLSKLWDRKNKYYYNNVTQISNMLIGIWNALKIKFSASTRYAFWEGGGGSESINDWAEDIGSFKSFFYL